MYDPSILRGSFLGEHVEGSDMRRLQYYICKTSGKGCSGALDSRKAFNSERTQIGVEEGGKHMGLDYFE